jgi:hypothetical protein
VSAYCWLTARMAPGLLGRFFVVPAGALPSAGFGYYIGLNRQIVSDQSRIYCRPKQLYLPS